MPIIDKQTWASISVAFTWRDSVVSTVEARFPYRSHRAAPRFPLDIVRVEQFFHLTVRLEELSPNYLDQMSWSRLRGQFPSYPVSYMSWSVVCEEEVDEAFGEEKVTVVKPPWLDDEKGEVEDGPAEDSGYVTYS